VFVFFDPKPRRCSAWPQPYTLDRSKAIGSLETRLMTSAEDSFCSSAYTTLLFGLSDFQIVAAAAVVAPAVTQAPMTVAIRRIIDDYISHRRKTPIGGCSLSDPPHAIQKSMKFLLLLVLPVPKTIFVICISDFGTSKMAKWVWRERNTFLLNFCRITLSNADSRFASIVAAALDSFLFPIAAQLSAFAKGESELYSTTLASQTRLPLRLAQEIVSKALYVIDYINFGDVWGSGAEWMKKKPSLGDPRLLFRCAKRLYCQIFAVITNISGMKSLA
jgi:hypothetical protein